MIDREAEGHFRQARSTKRPVVARTHKHIVTRSSKLLLGSVSVDSLECALIAFCHEVIFADIWIMRSRVTELCSNHALLWRFCLAIEGPKR